ncbi:MAG: BamA/TamA family outer membrane protein, partial [Bacteroidota bacterium]
LYPVNEVSNDIFYQFQGGLNLSLPSFLLPFPVRWLPKDVRRDGNLTRFSPQTSFGTNVRSENLREFSRITVSGNSTYRWAHIPGQQTAISQLSPFVIELINIDIRDEDFARQVDTLPQAIQRNFLPRFSSRLVYTYTETDALFRRLFKNNRNTFIFRGNIEIGGNIPYLLDRLRVVGDDTDFRDHKLGEVNYGQFFKGSMEWKFYFPFSQNPSNQFVIRSLIGGSFAWNYTGVVPPESRYYSGGTSTMRGWQSNTLGPGTFSLDELQASTDAENFSSIFAPGGETILELNAELRFDVYPYLKMAFFTDLGNVWFTDRQRVRDELTSSESGDGGLPENIVNRMVMRPGNYVLGWDAGVGFRFDFSFLILRLDLAQQLFAPDLVDDPVRQGWVIQRFPRDLGGRRWQFNLGIGYPF